MTDTMETTEAKPGRKPDRDFTVVNKSQQDLADYVNAHSGLDPVTANQVKAVLALRPDFTASPERKAERDRQKAEREAKNARYANLTDDQRKAVKKAEKAAERAAEARAEAERLLAGS